jgi:hypothetical protein
MLQGLLLMNPLSTAIAAKVAAQPAHYQAGIHAYRVALDERKDWHAAVTAAIEAALERKSYDDGKVESGPGTLDTEERCTCGSALYRNFMRRLRVRNNEGS